MNMQVYLYIEQNRNSRSRKSLEIDPSSYETLICNTGGISSYWDQDGILINGARTTGWPFGKK